MYSCVSSCFRCYKANIFALFQTFSCFFQILCIFYKHISAISRHLINAGVHTSHQKIGWTAALINSHKATEQISGYHIAASVENCSLRKRRQRFVKTLDYKVCPKLCSRCGEIIGKFKMCAVSLIDNKRDSMTMRYIRFTSDTTPS